ncbi:MAG TPA: RteC domain-containing protein [Chitinophagaceae bacterium]
MKHQWEHFYSLMLIDLRHANAMKLPKIEWVECCYWIAKNYWYKLKELFLERIIYADSEEIEFFRDVKPKFTSHIEYYLILSQGLLFAPDSPSEQLEYWEGELRRYQRFYAPNDMVINYYESGCHSSDALYFLQRNNQQGLLLHERIYEDMDCRSSHDHVVRGLLAHRMYQDYVQRKLFELQKNETVNNK